MSNVPENPADRAIPIEIGRTVLGSAPADPQAIHNAEAQVAAEWKVGDVVLNLYEVKQVHESGGMAGCVLMMCAASWKKWLLNGKPYLCCHVKSREPERSVVLLRVTLRTDHCWVESATCFQTRGKKSENDNSFSTI